MPRSNFVTTDQTWNIIKNRAAEGRMTLKEAAEMADLSMRSLQNRKQTGTLRLDDIRRLDEIIGFTDEELIRMLRWR